MGALSVVILSRTGCGFEGGVEGATAMMEATARFLQTGHDPGWVRRLAVQFGDGGETMTQSFVANRAEKRLGMKTTAMLVGRHGLVGVERVMTENVSPRGTQVISAMEWYVDDVILVSVPAAHYASAARVAYCDKRSDGQFVTGLEFVADEPLPVKALSADFSKG
jgi:hypothetical protein